LITANDIWQDDGVYKLTSIDRSVCNTGVRCEFKNAIDPFGQPSRYGPVRVEDALAVSSDTFFYRLGEDFYTLPGRRNELKADLEQFGFGADTGIDLPYEWDGRIPDDAVKKDLVEKGVRPMQQVRFVDLVGGPLRWVSASRSSTSSSTTPVCRGVRHSTRSPRPVGTR
jgi:penicillin-binding protein 2